jgi:hypothetical protein
LILFALKSLFSNATSKECAIKTRSCFGLSAANEAIQEALALARVTGPYNVAIHDVILSKGCVICLFVLCSLQFFIIVFLCSHLLYFCRFFVFTHFYVFVFWVRISLYNFNNSLLKKKNRKR